MCVAVFMCVHVWHMLSFMFQQCLPMLVCALLVVKLVSQIETDLYLNAHVSSVTFALFGALSCRVGTLKLSIIINYYLKKNYHVSRKGPWSALYKFHATCTDSICRQRLSVCATINVCICVSVFEALLSKCVSVHLKPCCLNVCLCQIICKCFGSSWMKCVKCPLLS